MLSDASCALSPAKGRGFSGKQERCHPSQKWGFESGGRCIKWRPSTDSGGKAQGPGEGGRVSKERALESEKSGNLRVIQCGGSSFQGQGTNEDRKIIAKTFKGKSFNELRESVQLKFYWEGTSMDYCLFFSNNPKLHTQHCGFLWFSHILQTSATVSMRICV